MNSGKIVSRVGDQTVVELKSSDIPGFGLGAFCEGRKIGVVFDVIGRTDKPYVVVRTRTPDDSLVGKQVQFK